MPKDGITAWDRMYEVLYWWDSTVCTYRGADAVESLVVSYD
jgi:hypothetical protein